MEIKVNNSFYGVSYFKFVIVLPYIILLIVGFIDVHIVQAEPFIRIYRNGVIYYYFSNDVSNPPVLKRLKTGDRVHGNKKPTAQELEPWIKWASQHHKVPDTLIKAVIRVESNFNPIATSPKGAQGLMQLMPGTAEQLQVGNAYDIRENIWAGTRYLGILLQKFNNNLILALAAYNAGPQRVEKIRDIPPIKETQGFVRDVCANFLQYQQEPRPSQ
jgi:hypothetical protein